VRRTWALGVLTLLVLVGCGGEAAEGDTEPVGSTTEPTAAQTLPWPAPSAAELLGKWDQEGQKVVAWFKPDGTFAIDSHADFENPFADGTYELEGSTLTFTSDPTGSCKGSGFVWEVGLDESGLDDRLQVLITTGACGAISGEQWTFARVG
jgi:hypothetical protein